MRSVLVHFHLYYHEQIDYFIKKLSNINSCKWDLYVTYVEENRESFDKILKMKPDAKLIKTENLGYDIFPFIQVIQSINLDDYDYVLKVHTKSGKKNNNKKTDYSWRDELVDILLENKMKFRLNLEKLKSNPKIGMICSGNNVFNCYTNVSLEDSCLLYEEMKLLNWKTEVRDFCAGTMFIAKSSVYKFLQNPEITKERFEASTNSGDSGTLAHVYERLLCIAVFEYGCKIYFKIPYRSRLKNFFRNLFSVRNDESKKHKIISILGIQFKIKQKFPQKNYYAYIEDGRNLQNKKYVPITEKPYNKSNTVKPIAFYLPQFHAIDLNDENFGKGFTEWTNVAKAIPQFAGHHQPHIPIDVGFYDLSTDKIMYRQIELAKMYGIYGFCFHYYWFSGKRLLEKPIFNYLNNKELDFPFMLCWANENWSRLWDGGDKEVIMEQKLQDGDDEKFFYDILPFLKDERYIKINNSPVLVIYRLGLFEQERIKTFVKNIKNLAKKEGFDDIVLAGVRAFDGKNPLEYGADKIVEFPPHEVSQYLEKVKKPYENRNFKGVVLDMTKYIMGGRYIKENNPNLFKGVFPSWDNTARKARTNASVFEIDPSLYLIWILNTIKWTKENHKNENEQFLFINAWNEWGEGAHLEPDSSYGYAYLQATKDALEKYQV